MLAALFVGMRLSVIEPQARRDRLAYLVIAASLILLAYQFYVHTQLDTHVEYQRHLYQLRKMGLIR